MKRFRRRTVIVLGVLVVAAIAAVSGYAYFSAAGTGSGSAYTGAVATIQLSGDASSGYLYPGGPAIPITVTVHNPGVATQYVGAITGAVSAPLNLCNPAWFTIAPTSYGYLAGGATDTVSSSISMPQDNNDNQSGCAGQTLTLSWSSTG